MKTYAKGLLRKPSHQLFKSCMPKYPHRYPQMPASLDLRQLVAPPENQGGCGSCWAFSITNSLRSYHMLLGKDPGPLSKNYLLLNQGPIRESGCNGGDFDAGQNMLGGKGPVLESDSPYLANDRIGYPHLKPVAATANSWTVVGDGCGKPCAQELCEGLWNEGRGACLSVDICADRTLEDYRSGVISKSTSLWVNHMVRLVGWNAGPSVDSNGAAFTEDGDWAAPGAYFILRNNWGQEWGIDGDCFIEYGVNNLAETAMVFR